MALKGCSKYNLQYNNLADLEKVVAMGYKEGWSMGLDQLDNLLQSITNK